MYVVYHGQYYTEGYLSAVYNKKSDAEKDIRKEGYKKEAKTGLFLNDNEGEWYRVDHFLYVDKLF